MKRNKVFRHHRSIPCWVLLQIAFTATACIHAAEITPSPQTNRALKPNILLIVADDMGYADAGFQGCKDIPTPNLNALAASGVKFTSGYVTGPYCSPTRSALMAGRHQCRYGHEFNPDHVKNGGLPLSETTLADHLKSAGYATGLVGKWHLGVETNMQPPNRGFDEYFGFLGGATDYFQSATIRRGMEPIKEKIDYTTDAFGREAVAFIDHHQQQPWFLYLAFNAVHKPMQATDDRLAKFTGVQDKTRHTYDAMMLALDENVGLVLKKLSDANLTTNTIVMFISDNGGPTISGTAINGSSNGALRGGKHTTLEGGVRVPFVISWPGRVSPGVYDKPVVQLDLHATAVAAAGIQPRPEWKVEGVNLLPFLDGSNPGVPHDALYWRFGEQMAIRAGDYKLVRYFSTLDDPKKPHISKDAKPTSARLYDLSTDIGEHHDLASEKPDVVKDLQARWDAWNAHNVAPLWGEGANHSDSDGAEPGDPIPSGKANRKQAKKSAQEQQPSN